MLQNFKWFGIANTYVPEWNIWWRAILTYYTSYWKKSYYLRRWNQTRSFCYIDDTVRGIYKLTISNYNLPVNIGNDQELSINELVNNIKLLLNSTNEIVFENLPENDPKFRKPDIELAKSILNWEPKVNLRDGLKKTISYFENLSNFKKWKKYL